MSSVNDIISHIKEIFNADIDPDIICSRVCRYTYGVDISKPFVKGLHVDSKQITIEKKLYCSKCFQKYFTIGQEVSLGESMEMRSEMSFIEDKQMMRNCPIYIFVYIFRGTVYVPYLTVLR